MTTDYTGTVNQSAQSAGVPPSILSGVIGASSNWNPYEVNGSSYGIAQLSMPIASQYGVNPFNAEASIDAAARYLADLFTSSGGDWKKALEAYRGGDAGAAGFASSVLSNAAVPQGSSAPAPTPTAATPTPGFFGPVVDWIKTQGIVLLLILGAIALVLLGGKKLFEQGATIGRNAVAGLT